VSRIVVFYSGGVASYCAARRVAEDNPLLLFTDTRYEDPDLYRFLDESANKLGCELVKIADGRTPWEVFRDERFLGNTRADPCSRILKRDLAKKWVREHFPESYDATLVVGLSWDETHRIGPVRKSWEPYRVRAPLTDYPLMSKPEMLAQVRADGMEPPRLYAMGFPHNNCGGFCVKAGQAHFRHLLRVLPEKYAEAEAEEQSLRATLGDVAILRDRRGGTTTPLPLRTLREGVEAGTLALADDWGGCGCFSDDGAQKPGSGGDVGVGS